MTKFSIMSIFAFFISQIPPIYLTFVFVQDNLGDDFFTYRILDGVEVKEIDFGAVFLLYASMSIPSIVITGLILLGLKFLINSK